MDPVETMIVLISQIETLFKEFLNDWAGIFNLDLFTLETSSFFNWIEFNFKIANFLFHARIPVVFDSVVSSSLDNGCHICPVVTNCLVEKIQGPFVICGPFGFVDFWIQMVVPSFAALFTDSTRDEAGYTRPFGWPILVNKLYYLFIFLFRPWS